MTPLSLPARLAMIVGRLTAAATVAHAYGFPDVSEQLTEARDRIEALQAQVAAESRPRGYEPHRGDGARDHASAGARRRGTR